MITITMMCDLSDEIIFQRERMAACDGAGLYSLLTSLDHPLAASLDPEALDWVCETPECADFLQWILNNLSRDNVVMDGDLEAFKLIPEEEVC